MRGAEIFPVGCSHEIAQGNFQTTVLNGVPQSTYQDHTNERLDNPAKIWGYRERGKGTWKQLEPGDYLLFYPGDWEYRYAARISRKERNQNLGTDIFQTPDEPFEYIVYLDTLFEVSIDSRELHIDFADYNIGHPVRSQPFNDRTYDIIQDRYGSVEGYLSSRRVDNVVVSSSEVEPDSRGSDVERPKRAEATVNRIVRNTKIIRRLKKTYDHQCQLCGETRKRASLAPYSEGHHIHPLGHNPPGPDRKDNVLILCPNHHADFDYGMIRLDVDTLEIAHAYDERVNNQVLDIHSSHELDRERKNYHNENIVTF